jgi:CYTH domain-containing protein
MPVARLFLVASSLARLIMRERATTRIVEGHFPASDDRLSYVLFDQSGSHLVLVTKPGSDLQEEERADVSAKQGEFLMEVCAGRLAYQRCLIEIGSQQAHVESFRVPEGLHLIEVLFDEPDQANEFVPPIWFGPEVTDDAGHERNAIATKGLPDQPEIALSDDAINALLDLLDGTSEERMAVPAVTPTEAVEKDITVEEASASLEQEPESDVIRSFPNRFHHVN